MVTVKVGTGTERRFHVSLAQTIDFLGADLRLYATPELVRDVEKTCLDFLLPYLEEGELAP